MQMDREPTVHTAANIFREMCYNYRDQLTAGIIVAGWDKEKGGQVMRIKHPSKLLLRNSWTMLQYHQLSLDLFCFRSDACYIYGLLFQTVILRCMVQLRLDIFYQVVRLIYQNRIEFRFQNILYSIPINKTYTGLMLFASGVPDTYRRYAGPNADSCGRVRQHVHLRLYRFHLQTGHD